MNNLTTSLSASDNQNTKVAHFRLFPRLEKPWDHTAKVLDASSFEAWEAGAKELLKIKRIDKADSKRFGDRFTKSKTGLPEPIPAKGCAPGIIGYALADGHRRGAESAAKSKWYSLIFDLDAAGCTTVELLAIVDKAFRGYRRLVWTTWSCKDGYASCRVFLLLEAGVDVQRLYNAFWWGRDRLLEAGLPEASVKSGEPTVDPRALDGKLFYLPAVPTPMVAGVEGWGGVVPTGGWGCDGDRFLDIADIEAEGKALRGREEVLHLLRYPKVPVPGGAKLRKASTDKATWVVDHEAKSQKAYTDFGDYEVSPGQTLLDIAMSLEPGEVYNVGSPYAVDLTGAVVHRDREPGDSILDSSTALLRREENGKIWLYSFVVRATFVHEGPTPDAFEGVTVVSGGLVEDPTDLDAAVAGFNGPSRAVAPSCYLAVDLDAITAPIVCLDAALGTGKTEVLKGAIAKADSAVVVMHRQALARELGRRFGIENYQDIAGPICLDDHAKVVVVANSFGRVGLGFDPLKLLVIEESESTIAHLYGWTMDAEARKQKKTEGEVKDTKLFGGDIFYRVLDLARDCIKNGGKVVLSDAHAGLATRRFMDVLSTYCGIDPKTSTAVVRHHPKVSWCAVMAPTFPEILVQIEAAVRKGERLVVACTSPTDVETLAWLIPLWTRADGTTAKVLAHYRDQDLAAKNALRNVEDSWSAVDVLLYSPTCDAGVSYARRDKPFTRRFVIGRQGPKKYDVPEFGAETLLQMSRRVRDVACTDPTITFWIDPAWGHNVTADESKAREQVLSRVAATEAIARKAGALPTTVREAEHFEVYMALDMGLRINTRSVARRIRTLLVESGATVNDAPTTLNEFDTKALRAGWTTARKDAARGAETLVDCALALGTSDYLRFARNPEAVATDGERLSLKRTATLDTFGEVDLDLLIRNHRGDARRDVGRFVDLRLLHTDRFDLAARREVVSVGGGYKASMTPRLFPALLVHKAWKTLFGTELGAVLAGGYKVEPTCGISVEESTLYPPNDKDKTYQVSHFRFTGPTMNTEGGSLYPLWVSLPEGVTLEDARTASKVVGLVDAAVVAAGWRAMVAGPKVKQLAHGCGVTSSPEASDHAVIKDLLAFGGLASVVSKTFHVWATTGKRVKVKVYMVDPASVAEMQRLSSRLYDRLVGASVAPLEVIDPKAPKAVGGVAPLELSEAEIDDLLGAVPGTEGEPALTEDGENPVGTDGPTAADGAEDGAGGGVSAAFEDPRLADFYDDLAHVA